MAELHDRDEFAMLVTVKLKYHSFRYTKFLTIRNQIFFQDVFFLIDVSFYFCFTERQYSCCKEKNMDFRVWLPSTLILALALMNIVALSKILILS